MKKQMNGNIIFITMVGIRSKSFFKTFFLINHMSFSPRWDTWAQADVLQKRTEKTEELFNKMNAAM
jgi:hypothetical protein